MKYVYALILLFLGVYVFGQDTARISYYNTDQYQPSYIPLDGHIYEGGTDKLGDFILDRGKKYRLGFRQGWEHQGGTVFQRTQENGMIAFVTYEYIPGEMPYPVPVDLLRFHPIGSGLYEGGIMGRESYIVDLSDPLGRMWLGERTGTRFRGHMLYRRRPADEDSYLVYFIHQDRYLPKTVRLDTVLTLNKN